MPRTLQLPAVRFWPKVQKTDYCWLWLAATRNGYGQFYDGNTMVQAHVWAWEQENGPVPDGLVLDHIECGIKLCVRPSHTEPKDRGSNVLRDSLMPNHVTFRQDVCARNHSMHDAIIRGTADVSNMSTTTRCEATWHYAICLIVLVDSWVDPKWCQQPTQSGSTSSTKIYLTSSSTRFQP